MPDCIFFQNEKRMDEMKNIHNPQFITVLMLQLNNVINVYRLANTLDVLLYHIIKIATLCIK